MNIKIKIGIVGLGYVGLPLFIEFLKKKLMLWDLIFQNLE